MSCGCRKAIAGAERLIRGVLGVGMAPEDVRSARTALCRSCEHFREGPPLATCKLCGCVLWAKVRLADEKCPAGKW